MVSLVHVKSSSRLRRTMHTKGGNCPPSPPCPDRPRAGDRRSRLEPALDGAQAGQEEASQRASTASRACAESTPYEAASPECPSHLGVVTFEALDGHRDKAVMAEDDSAIGAAVVSVLVRLRRVGMRR